MVPSSLGGRLLAGSALFTCLALLFTLLLMHQVLERFVTGQVDQRLDNKIVALSSQLRTDSNGILHLDGDADGPPFDEPRHRSFWWVQGPRNDLKTGWLRNGDFTPPDAGVLETLPALPRPPDLEDEFVDVRARTLDTDGFGGTRMHVRAARRTVGATPVTIFVAAPRAAIAGPMREAMTTIGACAAGLGLTLVLATLAQIRVGLRPLGRLRTDVAAVRSGARTGLPLDQPAEILPLVVEMNALLAENAENLARARRHVANLAHGLKTPLATLALSIERVSEEDRSALCDLIGSIDRRIRHHLGRARMSALGGPVRFQTPVAERIRDLAQVLGRIYAGKSIAFMLDCPEDLTVACEPHDLDEILGNVLDNAFKFGERRVSCVVRPADSMIEITVGNDGRGLMPDEIERVMHAGERLDEAVPGFGFGLAIVRELAELYAGTIMLRSVSASGIEAMIALPRVKWPVTRA